MSESSTNVETVVCEHEEYHDDLYPEFAPEQIHITCSEAAVAVMRMTDPEPYFMGDGTTSHVVCATHAVRWVQHCVTEGWTWAARLLSDDDREQYLGGAQLARETTVTDRQWLIASHEGWVEAGLCTPEHSHSLFDMGWEHAMGERLASWEVDTDRGAP
jgi:hypothetical protein